MSRNATSTPPAPYFPQRTATPTMRHATLPNFDQSRFSFRSPHHQPQPRRKVKPLPTPGGDSFEAEDHDPKWHNAKDVAAGALSEQGTSDVIVADAESPVAPVLVSPTKSWMPNLGRMAKAVVSSGMSMGISLSGTPRDRPATAAAKPIIETSRADAPPPSAVFQPRARYTRPPEHLLAPLSPEARQQAEAAWQDAEHKRVTECARLCSQWPQSGYHISKYGPQGARVQYEPQSSAHPEHVQAVMQRQAMMELYMTQHGFNFWPASESPRSSTSLAPSDDDDETSEPGLTDSSLPSPASSILLSADESLSAITTARLKAAMASPLIGGLDSRASSQVSLISQISGAHPVVCNSLGDLDVLASTMALSAIEPMEVDSESGSVILSADRNSSSKSVDGDSRPAIVTRSARAQSCGAKRPLFMPTEDNQKTEEDKRRKVDEEMVVEEAIETGVMQPAQRVSPALGMTVANRMSASAPDLSAVRAQSQAAQPSVFGHVVKTSDTHPIIISLFIPPELLPTLAQNLVLGGPNPRPPILSSAIDVPLLLLSHASSQQQRLTQLDGLKVAGQVAPVPTASVGRSGDKLIGNVMLSSCPGKRLRMDGPVKGRGPVFRDLATDLRRIKNEGVGALVCCLDDAELALLGVPWESYRDVASSLGLDIIRLPMPDGFTPVSLEHFDEHVSRIVEQYTLRGINVLIHCRGGVGRAGLTACAWAIKMGFVQPHPSLVVVEAAATRHAQRNPGAGVAGAIPSELEHQIVMSITERVIAMIRSRRGLKAIESFEQVQFLVCYVKWLRARARANAAAPAAEATA